jgi:hypothetical protein
MSLRIGDYIRIENCNVSAEVTEIWLDQDIAIAMIHYGGLLIRKTEREEQRQTSGSFMIRLSSNEVLGVCKYCDKLPRWSKCK